MGTCDMIFFGVLAVLAAVLTLSAVTSWSRFRRARYLVLAALCGLTTVGWTMITLSGAGSPEEWVGTLTFLLVCGLVLSSSQRLDKASQHAPPEEEPPHEP
ncbi:MAG: hypothetical protein E3J64_02470 [Anaerolineales bacterium]|nr:MAG: hypothetical protein E3J64_02470 [Anaerolineales bacterium]